MSIANGSHNIFAPEYTMVSQIREVLVVLIRCLILVSVPLHAFSQEFPMRVQALEGMIEVRQIANPVWTGLGEQMTVTFGDQIRTGDAGQAAVWLAEWGGLLLKPDTHVTLTALPSEAGNGIACAVHQGAIDIEVRDMPNNADLEVRHSIVTLSPQSSQGFATLKILDTMPEAIVQEGDFTIHQIVSDDLRISGFFDMANEGISFVQQAGDSSLLLSIDREKRSVRVQNPHPLPTLRALTGLNDDVLQVQILEGSVELIFQGDTVILDTNDIATFLISSDQELLLTPGENSHFQLWFRQFSFFAIADQGTIIVNGQEISPEDGGYFVIKEPPEISFFEERRENPVVPPPPLDIPPPASPDRPIGSPILP
jgi:hypothetical protein